MYKFAAAYLDHKKRYGAKEVREKLHFELITNRPIYPAFEQAIASIADQKPLSGEAKKQAEQFKAACGLDGKQLAEFAGKFFIAGLAGSLTDIKRDLSRTLVDWSAAGDALARARLGEMREMVRHISDRANDGEGQSALTRLLKSSSAKLASNVADGEWKEGLYPTNDPIEIASGLVWRMLGSPHASDRWRAAHSIRCFEKFERWKVIDALVARLPKRNAHPFQAPELMFYYMHARLWLLIALARIAMDDPKQIAKYQGVLREIVFDDKSPHVLMRHFASQAILTCVERGSLKLSTKEKIQIRDINVSPFPRLKKKLKEGGRSSFYNGRSEGTPKLEQEFHLDYDFEKYNVENLSDVFGKSGWEVKDMITEAVRAYDTDITSMYDDGGRKASHRNRLGRMTSMYHSYGQQLGWHALLVVDSRLLSRYPVTDDWYGDDPWTQWLNGRLLTRKDGLWLSDGMDRPPLATKVNLPQLGR